jgi:hypothetical protein
MAMDKALELRGVSIDEQLNELKAAQKKIGGLFNVEINQLELQKNANKAKQNALALEEKQAKIKEDLIRSVLESQTPRYPGKIDEMIPVEPEAQGLPLLPQG